MGRGEGISFVFTGVRSFVGDSMTQGNNKEIFYKSNQHAKEKYFEAKKIFFLNFGNKIFVSVVEV